jgi:peptidase YpeB-like protein
MTRTQSKLLSAGLTAALALTGVTAFAADPAAPPSTVAQAAPAATAAAEQPAAPAASATAKLLSLTDIEGRLTAQGIRMKEMEVHDKVLEVEGVDAQGRKIDLIVDRRSGEILSRKFDD